MRIAELSQRTGVAVPTIKYYLREGLLPPGERTSPNQARYDETHVRRLGLIRALIDIGGLSIAAVRDVLTVIDNPSKHVHDILGKVQRSITPAREIEDDLSTASADLTAMAGRRGWQVKPHNPSWRLAAEALTAMRRLGQHDLADHLDDYAELADRTAALDVALVATRPDLDSTVEAAVIGTVLGETLNAALRRLAHENASARHFPGSEEG